MTIGEKRPEKVRNDVPAPGNYNPDENMVKPTSKAVDFQMSAGRKDLHAEKVPGPGQYDIHKREAKQMTIGEKREIPIKNDVPAPGSYNPEDSLTKPASHQKTFSMS